MTKKQLMGIAAISLLTTFNSCREELVEANVSAANPKIEGGITKNGRLYFPNKESLTYAYDNVKDKEDEVIANYVDSKDIISLRPIITEKNEASIGEKLKKRISLLKLNKRYMASKGALNKIENEEAVVDDIDDLEDIIGDDAFGAFLDSRAEIQVANQIYKYTDVGLFIVEDSKYDKLTQYLQVRGISDDLMYSTELSIKESFIESQPSEEKVVIADGIEYYNANRVRADNGDHDYNPPYNPPTNPTDPNVVMNNYINNLPLCKIKHGLFGNLFGENDVCINQYESKYRVKTKAFNYDYQLVYHLGVKVKHQRKGFLGIWSKENVQEIRLGVQGIQFQYDFSDSFTYQNTYSYGKTNIYTQSNRYAYDASTFWNQNPFGGAYEMTGFSMSSFPKLMQDDIVIENFGRNTTADIVGLALAQANRQLTSDNLNKLFWENSIKELSDFWIKIGKPAPSASDNKITLFRKYPAFGKVLIHKAYYDHKYNNDLSEKTFDFGGEIKLNINPNNGNISASPGTTIKKPSDFMVKMYGVVKRNGVWHGSKIDNTRQ